MAAAAVKNHDDMNGVQESSSTESTPPASRVNSNNSLKELDIPTPKTLAARSRVPFSFYILAFLVIGAQYSGGIYRREVFESVYSSLTLSAHTAWAYLEYLRDLTQSVFRGEAKDLGEVATALCVNFCIGCVLYVLIYVPLRAGMWTGTRARRHKIHRYMGLMFLTQYFAAWIEYIAHYENGGKDSYLSHFVGINGIIQGVSAYFSFKVLPELADPGYYSDIAVLSRTFIHENIYFNFITFMGSCLYHDTIRNTMKTTLLGKLILHIFSYWLYVVVRPFFPITSFSNAGKSMSGRTEKNESFYKVGTIMVKVFYLWAKYFLGFFLNWVIALEIYTPNDMIFVRGLYLMNVGTISISVFLHTLRFKKALPPTLAFGIYLGQIYGTFLALPYCYDLFLSHKRLLLLAGSGLLVNMTRKRWHHAVWCGVCVYLLEFTEIEW